MTANYDNDVAAWGTPPEPIDISPEARQFLINEIGVAHPAPAAGRAAIEVAASRLSSEAAMALSATGARVSIDDDARLACGTGFAYLDLLARRGTHPPTSDAVVSPATAEQIRWILRIAAEQNLAVVPFGGGTSVVGGVRAETGPHAAVIALRFDQLADLINVDEYDMTVTVGPGMTGPVLERMLGARGLTVGHYPQSWERASIGGYAATRSAGQASSGYGRSNEMIESLTVITPRGDFVLGRAPGSAAGPDLRQLFIGSEGTFGVISEIKLRIRHQPSHSRYEGVMFRDYATALECFRRIEQRRAAPDVMRLSDEPETTASLALSVSAGKAALLSKYLRVRGISKGCLAILGWEGTGTQVGSRRDETWRELRRSKAVSLGTKVGESWKHGRFGGPYLRDVLMDEGYLVETLETATSWRQLAALRTNVYAALTTSLSQSGMRPWIMSHLSHVYETGGSLYVTVVVPMDPTDPTGQWGRAKAAACDAIMDAGATITHHHAVGRDHVPWLSREIGQTGVDLLRVIKQHLDPDDILNPGVLVADN